MGALFSSQSSEIVPTQSSTSQGTTTARLSLGNTANTLKPGEGHFPIFVSFRVKEARTQALALERALEERGYRTFCSESDTGNRGNWIRVISSALANCQLFIVLATHTYGAQGTDAFGTGEELAMAKRKRKDIYICPMATEWQDEATDMMLGTMQMGKGWNTPPSVVPKALLEDIIACCQDIGIEPNMPKEAEQKEQEDADQKARQIIRQKQESVMSDSAAAAEAQALRQRLEKEKRNEKQMRQLIQQLEELIRQQNAEVERNRIREQQQAIKHQLLQQEKADKSAASGSSLGPLSLYSSSKPGSSQGSRSSLAQSGKLPAHSGKLNKTHSGKSNTSNQHQPQQPQHQQQQKANPQGAPGQQPLERSMPSCIAVLKGPQGHSEFIRCLAFSPDGRLLVSGGDDKSVKVWEMDSKRCRATLKGHTGKVRSIVVARDNRTAVSASQDRSLRIWDLVDLKCKVAIPEAHNEMIFALSLSPNGNTVASASADKAIHLWDLSGKCRGSLIANGDVQDVAYTPKGNKLVTGGGYGDKSVRVWHVPSKKCEGLFQGSHNSAVSSVDTTSEKVVTSHLDDKTIRVWNLASGKMEHVLPSNGNTVYCTIFSPRGHYIYAASVAKNPGSEDTIRVFNVRTGHCQAVLNGSREATNSLAISPDGKMLASSSYDKAIKLWDTSMFAEVLVRSMGGCCPIM